MTELDVYLQLIQNSLARRTQSIPSWVEPEHVLAVVMIEHRPGDLTGREFAQVASQALATVLVAGEDASDKTRDLMIPETSTPSKVIPFDPEARRALQKDEADLREVEKILASLQAGRPEPNWTVEGALRTRRGLRAAIRAKRSRL